MVLKKDNQMKIILIIMAGCAGEWVTCEKFSFDSWRPNFGDGRIEGITSIISATSSQIIAMIITTTIMTICDDRDHDHNQISLGLCILGTGKLPWLNCLQNLHIIYRRSCPTGFQTFFEKYFFIVCLQVCFMHIIKIGWLHKYEVAH